VRGFVAAMDGENAGLWMDDQTVPAPGEPGSEGWRRRRSLQARGGAIWGTGTLDPAGPIFTFWGATGNAPRVFGDRGRATISTRARSSPRSQRGANGPLPVYPQRLMGLGRSLAAIVESIINATAENV